MKRRHPNLVVKANQLEKRAWQHIEPLTLVKTGCTNSSYYRAVQVQAGTKKGKRLHCQLWRLCCIARGTDS